MGMTVSRPPRPTSAEITWWALAMAMVSIQILSVSITSRDRICQCLTGAPATAGYAIATWTDPARSRTG